MKTKNILLIIGGVLLMINIIISIINLISTPKMAFVKSHELVYGYLGTIEMQNKFMKKKEAWQANIDTLQLDFKRAYNKFNEEVENLDQQQRAIKEQVLTDQKNDIIKYTQTINNNAKEEENKMLEGVLNQINSFSEEYGKTNGYDLVFGTTLSGSILYGCPARDITDEILEALNNRYKGID